MAWGFEAPGLVLLGLGGLLLIGGLWWAGRAHRHTVYRPEVWQAGDFVVLAGAAVAAVAYLVGGFGLDRASLFYYPYPALVWPGFSVGIGLATLGLAVPAVNGLRQLKLLRTTDTTEHG